MNRYLTPYIIKDLRKKIVMLSGPRQSGKTTSSKVVSKNYFYLNFDSSEDRKILTQQSWPRDRDLVIFDEVHKMKKWKNWLKGVYDKEGINPNILVTGSARLDIFRKGGDSLAGRFYSYRLHPFSVDEIIQERQEQPEEALNKILKYGGYPEPYLADDEQEARRWRRGHLDVILRQDLLDLEHVREIKSIEILLDLLASRVGAGVSLSSLTEDIQVSVPTIKHWLQILENLYVIFPVRTYTKNIARSILKESKYYFYDTGAIIDNAGSRLENTIAASLLKRLHFIEDTQGYKCSLNYLRDKEGREVDFLVLINNTPIGLIEVKTADNNYSKNLFYYQNKIKPSLTIQLVKDLRNEQELKGAKMLSASLFLAKISDYIKFNS